MRIHLIVIAVCFSIAGKGQTVKGMITSGGQPLPMANVMFYTWGDSSKPVVFLTSDSTGTFVANLPKAGNYEVRSQLIGFRPYKRSVTIAAGQQLDLGRIDMPLLDNVMKEVTVTGRRKLIQRTTTGFSVQTESVLTQAAGTAADLLSNIPTVLVDADGGVTIRGRAPLILINGRNSNLAGNLERIPASSIEKIEIINNPGAKYDADAEGGIVNIILKKNTQQGTTGAFALGGGYGAHERFNSSLLLNQKIGNSNLGLSYDNRIGRRTRRVETNRETFAVDDNHFLDQNRNDERKEINHNIKLTWDGALSAKDNLSIEGIYGYDNDWNEEPLYSTFRNRAGQFQSGNLRLTDERSLDKTWEGSMNYTRKLGMDKRQFIAGVSHSYGHEDENTRLSTTPVDANQKPFGDTYLQRTRNDEKTNVTNLRADLILPVSERTIIETGYKGILRHVRADFLNQYQDGQGGFITDPLLSNLFVFSENIHAIYGSMKSSGGANKQWKYELGLRLEQMQNRGESDKAPSFTNSYFNIFPNINVTYALGESQLRLNAGRRINRPWLGQLNPFIDITDSLNRYGGNPNLQPELVNTVELGWSKDIEGFSVAASLFYRRGNNTILPYTELLPNGVAFTQPRNIGSSTSIGVESFFTYSSAVWNSTLSVSAFHQEVKDESPGGELNSSLFTWYTKWVNNFNLFTSTRLQVLLNYQAPTAIPQGERIAVYNMDLGLQQKIMKGKARVGLTVTDVFNTLENGSTIHTDAFRIRRVSKSDTRAVLVTFALTFGSPFKDKIMENQYSGD